METDKSAWFVDVKVGVAHANVEKHKDRIRELRADIDAAFENLHTIDVAAWREEGGVLLKQMDDAARDLSSLEIDVGVSKVAGGTAAFLGGILSAISLLSGATLPLAAAGAVIGTAGGITSAGGELAKYSTFKSRLDDLSNQYNIFSKKTQHLWGVLDELLGLLKEAWQLIERIFGSLNLIQEGACESLNVKEDLAEQVWQNVDTLSAEGAVVLQAVGAIVVHDTEVIVTRIGMALRSLSKSLVTMHIAGGLSPAEPSGEEMDFSLPRNKASKIKAGIYISYQGCEALSKCSKAGIFASSRVAEDEAEKKHWLSGGGKALPKAKPDFDNVDQARFVLISVGTGVWDVIQGVKSLHQGSQTVKVLKENLQQAKDSISMLEEALEVVTRCITS